MRLRQYDSTMRRGSRQHYRLSICSYFGWLWQKLRIWDEQACLRGSPGADFGSLEKLNFKLLRNENWETMCWQCDDWQAGETGAGRREGEAVAPAATCPASTSSQPPHPDPHLMLNLWHQLPPIRKMSQADNLQMAENLQNEQPVSKYLDVTFFF